VEEALSTAKRGATWSRGTAKIDGVLEKRVNIDSLLVQIADYFPTSEKVGHPNEWRLLKDYKLNRMAWLHAN